MRRAELVTLQKRHEASIAAAKSAVEFRQAELSKVSKALASLSEEADLKAELKFFAAYFKEVGAEIKKAKEEADKRTKAASEGAKNAVPLDDGTRTEEIE